MPSLTKIQQVTEIALQNYPEIYARYKAGDRTVTAPINVMQHIMAELSRDIDVAEIEPFIKSREATILADASNKGILPLGVPCQHKVTIVNKGTQRVTILAGRVFDDGQGRPWRFLQNAEVQAGQEVEVLAEQSQVREIQKTIIETVLFNQFSLEFTDDMSLVDMQVTDQDSNIYSFITKWMNAKAGDYSITLKTNTLREIILEFGDSTRFGRTLEANTTLNITIKETYGEIDTVALKEAMLQQTNNSDEGKLSIRFTTGGLVRMGANPLTIDQMRLLASYPTHDDNAVFLGNFEFLVRKNFMSRCHYINVWNEQIQEQHYGASLDNINHLFVCVVPKHSGEYELICNEIERLISRVDSLYSFGNVKFVNAVQRPFNLMIKAILSPVHDPEMVQEQIKTLLISNYGKEQLATSLNQPDGFNIQEIISLINKNIPAFQDRQSDFKVDFVDIGTVKPNDWIFINAASISFDIQRSSGLRGGIWTVL